MKVIWLKHKPSGYWEGKVKSPFLEMRAIIYLRVNPRTLNTDAAHTRIYLYILTHGGRIIKWVTKDNTVNCSIEEAKAKIESYWMHRNSLVGRLVVK